MKPMVLLEPLKPYAFINIKHHVGPQISIYTLINPGNILIVLIEFDLLLKFVTQIQWPTYDIMTKMYTPQWISCLCIQE